VEGFVDSMMLGVDARKGAVQGGELQGVVEGELGGGGGVAEEMRALGAFDGLADVYSEWRAASGYRGVDFLPRRDCGLARSALFFFVVDLERQLPSIAKAHLPARPSLPRIRSPSRPRRGSL
jgi:hypothetical protein